jgi:PAS domain S-box-containing protein
MDSHADLAPEFFAKMVESVGVGVGIYGRDGRYLYVNRAYAELFDASPSELVGLAVPELVPAVDADRFEEYFSSFEDGETRVAETTHAYDGREVPVETITTQWTIDGPPYQFGTIKDISRRKAQQQEIRRQNERLENFARIVSHDLRNPLNVARGYIDILQQDGADRDELQLVDSSLDRMETLISELLTLARSNQGVGELEPITLRDVAQRAWGSVPTEDATVRGPSASVRVLADASRLQQLFENLFRNAVEHAGPTVTVTVGETADGFYVADDGPGVPHERRERVFETGYTTNEDGTGFGLSIVQQVVSGHGWEIRVTEGVDGGARFEVSGVEAVE